MRPIAAAASLAALALTACAAPLADVPVATAAASANSEDAIVADLLSRMSLERKVAQLIQPQINSFTAADMERYRFGSYLNGGNGGPYGDEYAPASEWLRLADEMYDASVRPTPNGEPIIPTMWGTDAVHGHTNVVGATIFPHNIGLGATRDADLVRRIGHATAVEIETTGIDWNFSPTVAVARDDRWGRSYESYSEDPRIVAPLGAALVEGLQGAESNPDRLGEGRVLATAKHFFGDGGTTQGVDQGDVNMPLDRLKAIHAVPYPVAIDAGVETIMASFNSVNGTKMHGNGPLLTDYLRGELGFDGVVVGDWNGHQQIAGCTVTNCPQSMLAGLDIYMVPDDWKGLMDNLVAQVRDGTIPMARLDEAAGRVLRMKLRAGILGPNAKRPGERANAGDWSKLGSPEHRAIAREAVAKSMVLLKNDGVLPLRPEQSIQVAGAASSSIAAAAGGWTLTWQGGDDADEERMFPNAETIYAGIAAAARPGRVDYTPDGSWTAKPDVAVVVFGEPPYAEFVGDRKDLVFRDEEGLEMLRKYRAAGIKTVAVFLSGRPLWMNREINAADAFVAAWLPGGEGGGVADVLFGKRPATGKLGFSWPAQCGGMPVNGAEGALYEVGYGLSLGDRAPTRRLDERCDYLTLPGGSNFYASGRLDTAARATGGTMALANLLGTGGGVTARGLDKDRQEDAREIALDAGASLTLSRPGSKGSAYRLVYSLPAAPAARVTFASGGRSVDITRELQLAAGKGWREMFVTPACLEGVGESFTLSSEGPMTIQVAEVSRLDMPKGAPCSF